MNAKAIAGVTVLAMMALAGCTGGFTVNQTEPIRVQLEGAPQTVVVHESDAEPKRVVVATCEDTDDPCDTETVEVQVQVKQVAGDDCRVRITIQDEDGNTIEERDVDVKDDGDDDSHDGDDNATGDNSTTAAPGPGGSTGQVVVQNIVVNVKGKDNVVILTQALQGSAEVQVNAVHASGNADVEQDTDDGSTMTTTATATATMTNTTSSGP